MYIPYSLLQFSRIFLPSAFFLILFFQDNNIYAQIGIGTNNPHPSAELDVSSSSKGFLLPRMGAAQRKAIVNPAVGLLVFDIDKNSLYMYDGSRWVAISTMLDQNVPTFTRDIPLGRVNDHIGFSVALDSNYAFIGAPLDSISGAGRQGAVYIMKKDVSSGWQFLAKLNALDVTEKDYFGYNVSIKGDYAIVGTRNDSANGSAYVFTRIGDTWVQQAKLTASDGAVGDMFGYTVAIYDNYAVIGAPKDDVDTSVDCGSAYFFTRTGTVWTEQAKLVAPDKSRLTRFGSAISLYGNNLVVGAPGGKCAAYPYIKSGNRWQPLRKLLGPPLLGTPVDFGNVVTLTNKYMAITDRGLSNGRVHTYNYADTGWIYDTTLATPTGAGAPFGTSACLSGDYLAIGSVTGSPINYTYAGGVNCYQRVDTVWVNLRAIGTTGLQSSSYSLGRSVALDGNSLDILIGAPGGVYGNEIIERSSVKGAFYFTNLQ